MWLRRVVDLLTLGTTQEVAMTTQTLPNLTAHDRCDRCGARAAHVSLHATGELLWCAHHWKKYQEVLDPSISF